ncbi:MAG: UbiD family decarboxylase [Rhodospirillaceae bacterium]|nr:UbiD family decarboxylase [Rhodospirillaceae bacterium]
MTVFKDLRDYLDELRAKLGDDAIQTVSGASRDLEIGCLSELNAEREGPALLFDDIPGFPRGFRVLTNYMGTAASCAVALGLAPNISKLEIVRTWKDRSNRLDPVPYVDVGKGAITENILEGDDLDLRIFPAPQWHEGDGGHYIGTADLVITRDPDSGWVNVGTYRACVQGKDRLSLWILNNHGRQIAAKYWARGQACPIAVVVGCEPTLTTAAAMSPPEGVCEFDLAGALRGKPVEVLYPPGSLLPVPAYAEIVIEGEMPSPSEESVLEGPFGEWTGYYTHSGQETVVRVKRIMHRNNPIILGAPPMIPTITPGDQAVPLYGACQVWRHLDKSGVENVRGVWAYGRLLMFVIAVKQTAPGQARRALTTAATSTHTVGGMQRYYIVVDDDIDITDINHVLWALCTRVRPIESIEILNSLTTIIDPRIAPDLRAKGDLSMGKVLIDACKPFDWIDKYPGQNRFEEPYRSEIRERWSSRLRL